jgi:DNA-binding NtrC family response regulator
MIKKGTFREDLYHRLDLLRMKIPPLAQREEGILLLARHFLSSLSSKYNLPIPRFSANGEKQLLRHSWPGNARELAHELERSLVMHEKGEELSFNLLPTDEPNALDARKTDSDDWLNAAFRFPAEGFDLEKAILRLIEMGIDQSSGNVSEAARLLGVPRDYLRYRLQKKDG